MLRKIKNEDIRTILRNADALRSGRKEDMDTKLDRELVKYLAAFVDAEEVFKRYEVEEEEVNMCTMLNKMISDGKAEGKAEYILDLLGELGAVPEKLRERIMGEKNLQVLQGWFKQALHSETIGQFQEMM